MADAITRARQALGIQASDDAVADLAASFYSEDASPADRDRLFRAAGEQEVFAVLLEHATDFTAEQIAALALTEAQATRMAHARQRC